MNGSSTVTPGNSKMMYRPPIHRNIQQQKITENDVLDVALKLDGLQLQEQKPIGNRNPYTRTMEELLEEISTLECHFKWVNELTTVDSAKLSSLQDRILIWIGESSDVYLNAAQAVTQHLLLSTYASLLENSQEALKSIAIVDTAIKEAETAGQDPPEHLRVFQYVLLACKLNVLCRIKTPSTEMDDMIMEIESLIQSISQIDVSGPICQAAFLATKGNLLNQLDKTETHVEVCRKIVLLNPNFYYWHHQLYSSLRKLRRETSVFSAPSKEEINACETALKLQRECCWVLKSAALMYEEILRTSRKSMTSEQTNEMQQLVIECLESAVEANPNSIGINISLAEAYASTVLLGVYSNTKKSEELFRLCEKKWPQSSMVFHKFGKFYLNIIRDTEKAMSCFERSLEADKGNFPCLMDYLKLRQNKDSVDQLIRLLDSYIPIFINKKAYSGKLMILKGVLLWNQNREDDAVKLWLVAFRHNSNPGLRQNFKEYLLGKHSLRDIARPVNIKALKNVVSELKSEPQEKLAVGLDLADLTEMETFLLELQPVGDWKQRNNSGSYSSNDKGYGTMAPRSRTSSASSVGENNVSNTFRRHNTSNDWNGASRNERVDENENRQRTNWNTANRDDAFRRENWNNNGSGHDQESFRHDRGHIGSRHNNESRVLREDQQFFKAKDCFEKRQRLGNQQPQGNSERDDNWRS